MIFGVSDMTARHKRSQNTFIYADNQPQHSGSGFVSRLLRAGWRYLSMLYPPVRGNYMAENGNELHVSQKGENCGYFPDQLTEISVLFLRQLGLYEPEMDTLISQIWIRRAAMNPGDGDELRRVMFEKM